MRPSAAVRIRSSVGLKSRRARLPTPAAAVTSCRVAVIPVHIRHFLSLLSHEPPAGPAEAPTPLHQPGVSREASSAGSPGTTNMHDQRDQPDQGGERPEDVGRRPPVGERDVVAGRHDHHQVGGHPPGPVGPAGVPVGEVGDLDQHGRPHPGDVEADGGVGLGHGGHRVVPACLTVGPDVAHRRPGPRRPGRPGRARRSSGSGRCTSASEGPSLVALPSQLDGAGFTPESTTGSLASGVTSAESLTR